MDGRDGFRICMSSHKTGPGQDGGHELLLRVRDIVYVVVEII